MTDLASVKETYRHLARTAGELCRMRDARTRWREDLAAPPADRAAP